MSIHKRNTAKGIRYDVKLRRPDGTQYSKSFKTRKEADAYDAQQRAARDAGIWLDDRLGQITFCELAERWLTSNPNKRATTLKRDQGIITNHLNPAFGAMSVRSIKRAHIIDLVTQWNSKGLRPATIRRNMAILNAIFTFGIVEDIINKSPTLKVPTPRVDPDEGRPIDAEEAQRLLEALPDHYHALVYLMITTGLRWSEAAGLQIRDFKPLSNPATLTVERSLHNTNDGVLIEKTKSRASQRVIPLAKQQVEVISKHLKETGRNAADAEAPLFTSPNGKTLDYSNFHDRVWAPATKKADLAGLKIKDLRKTAATNLVKAGIDLKTITAIMGHEDIRTTMRHYAQPTVSNLIQAAKILIDGAVPETNDDRRIGEL